MYGAQPIKSMPQIESMNPPTSKCLRTPRCPRSLQGRGHAHSQSANAHLVAVKPLGLENSQDTDQLRSLNLRRTLSNSSSDKHASSKSSLAFSPNNPRRLAIF